MIVCTPSAQTSRARLIAVHGHLAVLGVDPHGDACAMFGDEFADKAAVGHRLGPDHNTLDAGQQRALHAGAVTQAATHLDFRAGRADGLDCLPVAGSAREGTVEVDDMNPLGSGLDPAACGLGGVVEVHGFLIRAPLVEAHGASVLDVDCGIDVHDLPLTLCRTVRAASVVTPQLWQARKKQAGPFSGPPAENTVLPTSTGSLWRLRQGAVRRCRGRSSPHPPVPSGRSGRYR